MKAIKPIILGLLLGSILSACVTVTSDIRALQAWEPSSQDPEFVILKRPQLLVELICIGEILDDVQILGCVQEIGPFKRGEACLITIASDLPSWFYDKILRHEKAHCRGWHHGQPVPTGDFG